MNQKKCKALRKVARELTVGAPERKLVYQKIGTKAVLRKDERGKDHKVVVETGCLVNNLQTTRGAYRRLKKEAKRGAL